MMQTTKDRKLPVLILLILTLCFIWGNSLLPSSVSGAFSCWVKELLNTFLGGLHDGYPTFGGDGVLRKIAHASEFALLGSELFFLFRLVQQRSWSAMVLCGLAAALIDETIQLFVVGRSGQVQDIWIDFGGLMVGVVLSWLIHKGHAYYRSSCSHRM